MISRRLLRVKVFKILFSRIGSGSDSLQAAEKELMLSCEKSLDLYYFLMALPISLRSVAQAKIEAGLSKFHPTPEEANPNRKFVNNKIIELLDENPYLLKGCESRALFWNDHISFVKKLYATILQREYFLEYMNSAESSIEEDAKVIIKIFEEEFEDNDDLYEILEDMNLYWADDLAYVINILIKRLEGLAKNQKINHPQVFLKDEDRVYANRLLTQSLVHYNEYIQLMSKFIHNWEPERLAAADAALIVLGISEAIAFPNIPLKVTINEFVEIAKYYSTPNSKIFVNGILDKVLTGLQAEGKIEKSGRGLVGSIE